MRDAMGGEGRKTDCFGFVGHLDEYVAVNHMAVQNGPAAFF